MMAAVVAVETANRFMAGTVVHTKQGPVAGEELPERGARRSVAGLLGTLQGFAQLGVPKRAAGRLLVVTAERKNGIAIQWAVVRVLLGDSVEGG